MSDEEDLGMVSSSEDSEHAGDSVEDGYGELADPGEDAKRARSNPGNDANSKMKWCCRNRCFIFAVACVCFVAGGVVGGVVGRSIGHRHSNTNGVLPVSVRPTASPTATANSTVSPTTVKPTFSPTTANPTFSPTTANPTFSPTTAHPTFSPTSIPTASSVVAMSLWSIDHAGKVYTQSGLGEWVLVGGNVKQISLCGDRVWGVDDSNENYKFVNGRWTKFGSNLVQISCSGSSVWGVNKSNGVFYLDTNDIWQHVGGDGVLGGNGLRQITTSGSEVWGVDANEDVFYRNGPSGTWTKIDGTLQVQLSAASGHVWAVDWQDRIYYRFGTQGDWQQVGGGLSQVAARPDGGAIGVNRFGTVMAVDGPSNPGQWKYWNDQSRRSMVVYDDTACDLWITNTNGAVYSSCDGGQAWNPTTSGYVKIAASGQRVWALDSSHNIFTCDSCAQKPSASWTQVPGQLVEIAVSGIHVWGINVFNKVLYSNSTDGNWRQVSGNRTFRSLSVSGSDVWGVDNLNVVYYRDVTNGIDSGEWKQVGTQLIKTISVSNGQVWGVDSGNNVLYRDGINGSWTSTNAPQLADVAALPAGGAFGVSLQRELYKVDYYTLNWTQLDPGQTYSPVSVASGIL